MVRRWERPTLTPLTIALIYALASGVWVLGSDLLVERLFADPGLITQVQTVKGWLFVGASALLIYWLVRRSQRQLERSNERLETALQQTSILHRIVRHDLRNTCNVIRGNLELLEPHLSDGAQRVDVIRRETNDLIEITRKTRKLRTIVLDEIGHTRRADLASIVASQAETARSEYPNAEIRTDLPERAMAEVHPHIDAVIGELIENAIEHNDRPEPKVWLAVDVRSDGSVTVEIADDGPGIPAMEREVLGEGIERPIFHSRGLGLWLAQTVVGESDGEFEISDNEPRGSIVRITF